ncbi:MAG TPA: HAD family phosphatase [Isosphaeraceae bacterium]|nr:HAD family phosphatase [Isosphaeraceae bacterium]
MLMRQHALIFDFGNVVGFFDYLRACERFGARLGVTGPVFRQRMLDEGFAQILGQFESGRITPHGFAREVMARSGLSLTYEEFVRDWEDIFWLNEPVARLIDLLKSRGYTLILGSNTNVLHATHYRRQFAATLDQFNDLVFSHEVGYVKPEPGFYAACVAAAGFPAASCVFVDDVEENVEGARRAGLTAVQYMDTPRLIADLRRLGVEIPPGEC